MSDSRALVIRYDTFLFNPLQGLILHPNIGSLYPFIFLISISDKNVKPFPFYVTTVTQTNQVTYLTQRLLAYYTGQIVPDANSKACDVFSSSDEQVRFSVSVTHYLLLRRQYEFPSGMNMMNIVQFSCFIFISIYSC